MNLSSPDFISLLKKRDEKSFEILLSEYQLPLFRTALKLKLDMDQAEEVVQQTWTTLYERIESFEGRSHIRTYIFGILYNKIKELWRSNKKYTEDYSEDQLDQLYDQHGSYTQIPLSPEQWGDTVELSRILSEKLDLLPEAQRLAFYLKEIQGEKTEDICNILGIKSTHLGVLIFRAKTRLRTEIEKEYDD